MSAPKLVGYMKMRVSLSIETPNDITFLSSPLISESGYHQPKVRCVQIHCGAHLLII